MSTELSKTMSNTEMIIHNFTDVELDTLKKTIAKGTTNEQFALFVSTCKRSKLDPFLNQIHCIVYIGQAGPVMSIQFPVEGYVADAKRNPDYRGYQAAVVKEHDFFEADISESTVSHKVTSLVRGKTLGSYCKVFREGRPDVLVIVTIDQLEKHIAKSKNKDTIDTWYDDFVIKHAVKRAFKIQFGIDFVDEDDGGNTTDGPNADSYKRKDITDEANALNGNKEKLSEEKKPEEPVLTEAQQREAAYQKMLSNFIILGIPKDDQGSYVTNRITMAGKKLTLDEFSILLKKMDEEIQLKTDDLPD